MLKIVDSNFPVREIPICFNAAMKLCINELESNRIFEMTFPEFLEAFCRVIDKYSPVPPGEIPENMTAENRAKQLLNIKLDNIISVLIKSITHPDSKTVKEKFVVPMKDDYGLYKFDKTSQFYASIWPIAKKRRASILK
jgi:hypothetical protein